MGQLTIDTLALRARSARDRPPIPGLTGDLSELVPRLAVPLLAGALDRSLPADDPSVWLIRELKVDLTIRRHWDAERIARRIAMAIAGGIGCALRGETGSGVVRLDDRAAHLAAVLQDIAAGTGRRWYHGPHGALFERPRSQALAALLQGAEGPRALAAAGAGAPRIVRGLQIDDAREVAHCWMLDAAPSAHPAPEQLQCACIEAIEKLSPDLHRDSDRAALLVFARVGASSAGIERAPLAAAVRAAMKTFALSVEDTPWQPPAHLPRQSEPSVDAIVAPSRTTAQRKEGGHSARRPRSGAAPEPTDAITPHAALFVLWRIALQTSTLAHASALVGDVQAGAMMLARALEGSAEPHADRMIRRLLRLDDEDDRADVSHTDIPLDALLELVARDSEAWPPLRVSSAVLEACAPCHILADAATGAWLWAWPNTPRPEELRAHLAARADGEVVPLLLDRALADQLAPDAPRVTASDGRAWIFANQSSLPSQTPNLARLPGRIVRDFAALSHTDTSDPQATLAWAFLARRVYWHLARRVPGFAHAGIHWLRENLLPRTAIARMTHGRDGEELAVTLQPPPLAMVLRMTGLASGRYVLPGLPPVSVNLVLQGS